MMQRMKDYMNKVQAFIIEKRNFSYWVVMVIALMMFANTELLSMIIPTWATYLINAVLIIVTTVYARLLIVNIKERIKEKKTADETKLYAFLEQSFKDTEAAVRNVDENVTNSTEFIKNELRSSMEMILTDIEAKKKDISEELASVQRHEAEAYELLKNRIDQFEAANKDQLENSTSKVLNSVKTTENSLKENLSEQTNLINRNAESNKININDSREALLQEIKSNGNKAEENTANINKNIEEVRNMLTESVTKLLETTDASLQTVQKENIDNIANQTKELIAKLDNILEENKHSFDENLEELEKSRDLVVEKLSTIDEANQVKTKEYYEIVEGKLASTDERLIKEFANIGTNIASRTSELIEKLDIVITENKNSSAINLEELQKTCDTIVDKIDAVDEANQMKTKEYHKGMEERLVSTDEKLMKKFENIGTSIANQTSELTEKLDTVIMENKNGSAAHLEELQKTRDIIVDKITNVDEANQVKEQEYYNSVEEKLNASDDKVLREFANIKELAKEMEEKRTEADSTAFDGVHAKANEILSSSGDLANKLNMVSETLEGFEQRTVSAIAESSATVSQEVKDGVIQSTSHMNDVSEKVIETIQKNDNDTVEKLNHQRQEILSAISGSEIKAQENYDSLVGVLSEVKISLNEVETEISNAEKGNAELTEELKKSIASEIQNIGDELSKIEGTQKDNVVQIMELVDSKLLELNQELVKQANSILDKSDENTDYVSEKYNRVFDQIQSVAKESKILINRVNDAIEENKNTIIQSQNVVTDSIGSHFQNVKNKEKELESFKAVVERNFLNISSELEITRGQLSSLNSLSVLIKNLSEKREDKVEKKQNRIETIEDPDSGLTVNNEYKQDKLVTSQMFRGSKKVYDVFYGNRGEIVSTKNYDESGKVSLEMTYHPNGQVKERIEYISGKAELSKFDANGNKIK